jgi:hypothetical protein
MIDPTGPDTFWLNATNIALGLVTLACFLVIAAGVWRELVARQRSRAVEQDDHAFVIDGLGLTMADGGERVSKAEPRDGKKK